MKKIAFAFLICLLYMSCKKDNAVTDDNNNVIDTLMPGVIPAATPINTAMEVYAIDNNQASHPLRVSVDNVYFNYLSGALGFSAGSLTADKYGCKMIAPPQLTADDEGYNNFRCFPITTAAKNYANIKALPLVLAGSLNYDNDSGTFPLTGGGEIYLPPYAAGHISDGISVAAGYLYPGLNDYAVSNPCYSFADIDGKRKFLNSYGSYVLIPQAHNSMGYNVDFAPGAGVSVKLPIPASMLGTAPDTIKTFNLVNGIWKLNGLAHKAGNFYEKTIDQKGLWNFAVPADGIYITLHLETEGHIIVANTRVKIKNGADEVADGRTNSNGDVLLFVPANKSLSMDVINDHFSNWSGINLSNLSLGSFSSSSEKTYTIPARVDLATYEGDVYNCDGSSFGNGSVLLTATGAKDNYIVPIVNGHFIFSNWLNYNGALSDLAIRDNAGNSLITYKLPYGDFTGNVIPQEKIYHQKFYTCESAAKVYFNYQIDGTSYSISGDAGAATPSLTGTTTHIHIDNNGSGIDFIGGFNTVGNNYFLNGLSVNNGSCQFDDNTSWSEIIISRLDPVGGFIEGWLSIYYKDASNVSHQIKGSFRVKRTA